MAKYKHAYIIPDGSKIKGGVLYDRWGNLTYFADVSGLEDLTQTAADKETAVKSHSREKFMRSKGKVSVKETTRYYSTGLRQSKGAIPGSRLTLSSGSEKRDFMYDGNISGFVAWLRSKAKVNIDMFGSRGTPYDPIPKVENGGE